MESRIDLRWPEDTILKPIALSNEPTSQQFGRNIASRQDIEIQNRDAELTIDQEARVKNLDWDKYPLAARFPLTTFLPQARRLYRENNDRGQTDRRAIQLNYTKMVARGCAL
jgi:hypothetical protein